MAEPSVADEILGIMREIDRIAYRVEPGEPEGDAGTWRLLKAAVGVVQFAWASSLSTADRWDRERG